MKKTVLPLLFILAAALFQPSWASSLRPRYIGEIYPTPKQAAYEDAFLQLTREGKPLASLAVGPKPTPGEKTAVEEIESLLGAKLPPAKEGDKCVISVGRTALAEKSITARPIGVTDEGFDKEGYIIRFERQGSRESVILYGPGSRGALYAAVSFCQLVRRNRDDFEVRRADVTDWPTFLVRCTPMRGYSPELIRDEIDFRSRVKINGESFHFMHPLEYPNPGDPPPHWQKVCMDSAAYARSNDRIGIYEYVNAYPWESEGQINITHPDEIERLIRWFDSALSAGVQGIMLCLDDTPREITYEELIRFRDMGYAHAYLYRQIYDSLRPKYPDRLFLFLPVVYGGYPGNQQDKDYLNILAAELPSDVGFVWTGPGGQANRIDQADIELQSSYIGGRKPYFWDNSAGWTHKISPGIQFLEPYRTKLAPDMAYQLFARGSHLLNPCDDVYMLTWADYLWNPDVYNPEKSWRKALAILAGEENVQKLIDYNHAWTRVYEGFAFGEGMLDDTSEYDTLIRRMEEIATQVSAAVPKQSGISTRLGTEAANARTKLTEWTTRMAAVRRDCAASEQSFHQSASRALASPKLEWRIAQGNGWTSRQASVGLSGKDAGGICLSVYRDPVYFPSRSDSLMAEARITLPGSRNTALEFLVEDGDVRPVPAPDAKPYEKEPLLQKTIRLNGQIVWQTGDARGPAAEVALINVPDKLLGKTSTLSLTVENYDWSPPRAGEKVCLIGPIVARSERAKAAKPSPQIAIRPIDQAVEALKQLPASFKMAEYSKKSYSGLLECIIRDPALASVESRVPLESRVAVARGMWNDGRPAKAVECLLRKGKVMHLRPGGRSTVTGISDPMSVETEAMLTEDRPVAFCRRTTRKITVDGSLDDWSNASWRRLNESVSAAAFDPWDPIKKFVNFAENDSSPLVGPDAVELKGRARFVSFNQYFMGNDIAARFAAAWDDCNLYLAADITDNALCNLDSDRSYGGDHVRFYIDALDDQTDLVWDDDTWYQVSTLGNLNCGRGTERRIKDSKATYMLKARDRGYIVEIAIPWQEIGLAPSDGHRMGFDVRVRDRDSERECKTIWWRAVKESRVDGPWRAFGLGELQIID